MVVIVRIVGVIVMVIVKIMVIITIVGVLIVLIYQVWVIIMAVVFFIIVVLKVVAGRAIPYHLTSSDSDHGYPLSSWLWYEKEHDRGTYHIVVGLVGPAAAGGSEIARNVPCRVV